MTPVKVLIADEISLTGLNKFPEGKFSIKCAFGVSNSEIQKKYSDFDVLVIRSIRKIDKSFLNNTRFKIIATCSKGTDHIDIRYAHKKRIKILNAEESNNISAAEHTMALILSIEKKIILADKLVRENKFDNISFERHEIYKKKIGIIGFGKVGSYVGQICKSFGMEVYANDIDRKLILQNKIFSFKSLRFILRNCELITFHIPLNKKNFHFISKKKLQYLNPNSILINTSRGDIIDEKYLLELLKKKKIKYAGLDVFSHEPNIDKAFGRLDNVILTNHIAGKTFESKKRISEHIFSEILKAIN